MKLFLCLALFLVGCGSDAESTSNNSNSNNALPSNNQVDDSATGVNLGLDWVVSPRTTAAGGALFVAGNARTLPVVWT
ncbi:MAG: hypothetical protein R3E66_05625 [bacterium]